MKLSRRIPRGQRLVTAIVGMLVGLVGLSFGAAYAQDPTCRSVQSLKSEFGVMVDGQFSGGLDAHGNLVGEWSDVNPLAFKFDAQGNLFRTCPDDPAADTILYAAIAPGCIECGQVDDLYLMYDFIRMTDPSFAGLVGATVVQVTFPVTLTFPVTFQAQATVRWVVSSESEFDAVPVSIGEGCTPPSSAAFFQALVDLRFANPNLDHTERASELGLEAKLGFGKSPNSNQCHVLAELEVPLGIYDPNPHIWSSAFKIDPNDPDPPGTFSILSFSPDHTVTLDASSVPVAALSLKQTAVAKLQALLAGATNKHDREKLNDAIKALNRSLTFFVDQAHPRPKGGEKVFAAERDAVESFLELIHKSALSSDALRQCVALLVAIDRGLAEVAIADAQTHGSNTKKIAKALNELARGDAAGDPEDAIEHYEDAWKEAVKHREEN